MVLTRVETIDCQRPLHDPNLYGLGHGLRAANVRLIEKVTVRPSPFLPTPSRIDFALVNKSLEIHLQKAVISKQQAGATEPGQRDYVRIVGLANPRILNSFSLCIHPGIVEIYSSSDSIAA